MRYIKDLFKIKLTSSLKCICLVLSVSCYRQFTCEWMYKERIKEKLKCTVCTKCTNCKCFRYFWIWRISIFICFEIFTVLRFSILKNTVNQQWTYFSFPKFKVYQIWKYWIKYNWNDVFDDITFIYDNTWKMSWFVIFSNIIYEIGADTNLKKWVKPRFELT